MTYTGIFEYTCHTRDVPKHKKPFISAPERARAILSVFSDHLVVYTRSIISVSVICVMSVQWNADGTPTKSTAEMDSWPNFKLFRPKLSLNRTKNGSNTSGIVPKFETYTKTHGLTWRTSLGKPLSSRESLPARESLLAHLSPLAASLSLSLCLSLQ